MAAAFTIRVLESIIRIEFVETLSAEDNAALRSPWSGLEVEAIRTPDATIRVVVGRRRAIGDGTEVVAAPTLDEAAQSLATALTLEGIYGIRGRAVLLHAAGVALDDGRVVGFVGPSGRGKTTASRALAQHFGYVTDETLAIRPDLSVIPYPKPLSVLMGSPPKVSISPPSVGMRGLPETPLILSRIALLDRRPDVGEAYLEDVRLADAVGLIAPETSSLVALSHPLGALVDILRITGGVSRVVYGEADQLPAIVPDLLARDGAAGNDVKSFPPEAWPPPPRPLKAEGESETLYRRARWVDAVRIDDQIAVHDGHRLFVLDGLGPELWAAADDTALGDIVAHVTHHMPPPADADVSSEVARQLEEMADAGLLLRR